MSRRPDLAQFRRRVELALGFLELLSKSGFFGALPSERGPGGGAKDGALPSGKPLPEDLEPEE